MWPSRRSLSGSTDSPSIHLSDSESFYLLNVERSRGWCFPGKVFGAKEDKVVVIDLAGGRITDNLRPSGLTKWVVTRRHRSSRSTSCVLGGWSRSKQW